ncbi:hypothetical protein [[Ruminococcus] torques]|uniref:hypothetical protein n=1 Tax=Mediterraneibacter TaxID=2316020 RepID=UPI001642BAA9
MTDGYAARQKSLHLKSVFTFKQIPVSSQNISLIPEKTELSANGHALAYVRIEIVDENGVVVPDAAVKLHADVEGAGKPAAFGSANPITDENYTTGDFISYRGVATAIIQSGYEAGLCTLTVSGEGFEEKSVELKIK